MPWIPLAAIAVSAAMKIAEDKRQADLRNDEHKYQQNQNKKIAAYNIRDAYAKSLGAMPYRSMADHALLGENDLEHQFQQQEKQRPGAENNIGLALQGISATKGALGDNKLGAGAFGKLIDERPGYDALKAAESGGSEIGDVIGSAKPFDYVGNDLGDLDIDFGGFA